MDRLRMRPIEALDGAEVAGLESSHTFVVLTFRSCSSHGRRLQGAESYAAFVPRRSGTRRPVGGATSFPIDTPTLARRRPHPDRRQLRSDSAADDLPSDGDIPPGRYLGCGGSVLGAGSMSSRLHPLDQGGPGEPTPASAPSSTTSGTVREERMKLSEWVPIPGGLGPRALVGSHRPPKAMTAACTLHADEAAPRRRLIHLTTAGLPELLNPATPVPPRSPPTPSSPPA